MCLIDDDLASLRCSLRTGRPQGPALFETRKGECQMGRNKRIFKTLTLIAGLAILAACAAPATPTAAPTAVPQATVAPATVAPTAGPVVNAQDWRNGWFSSTIGAREAVGDKLNQDYHGGRHVDTIDSHRA